MGAVQRSRCQAHRPREASPRSLSPLARALRRPARPVSRAPPPAGEGCVRRLTLQPNVLHAGLDGPQRLGKLAAWEKTRVCGGVRVCGV